MRSDFSQLDATIVIFQIQRYLCVGCNARAPLITNVGPGIADRGGDSVIMPDTINIYSTEVTFFL